MEPSAPPLALDQLLVHDAWLRRLAAELVRDPGTAEDIVQETWLAAIQTPEIQKPKAWLGRVLGLRLRTHLRRRTLQSDAEFRASGFQLDQDQASGFPQTDILDGLTSAIGALPEPLRSTLVDHYFHGITSVQAAESSGIPQGTVRWRLKRGREELRNSLERRFGKDSTQWMPALALFAQQGSVQRAAAGSTSIAAIGSAHWLGLGAAVLAVLGGFLLWQSRSEPGQLDPDSEPFLVDEERGASDLVLAAGAQAPAGPRSSAEDPGPVAGASTAPTVDSGPAQSNPLQPDPPQLVVEVTSAETSQPIQGARAVLFAPPSDPHSDPTEEQVLCISAADGLLQFSFQASDFHGSGFRRLAGMASVRFDAPGHSLSTVHSFTPEFLQGLDPQATLKVALPNTRGSLSGMVHNSEGQPLEGALVLVSRRSLPQFSSAPGFTTTFAPIETRTGADGRYSIEGLPAMAMTVRFRAPMHLEARSDIEVEDGVEGKIDLRLNPAAICRGTVTDQRGHPVVGAKVWHDPVRGGLPLDNQGDPGYRSDLLGFCRTVTTDAGGAFELSSLRPGPVRLWAQHPGDPAFVQHTEVVADPNTPLAWNPSLLPRRPLVFRVIDHLGLPQQCGSIRLLSASGVDLPWRRNRPLDEDGTLTIYDWVEVPTELTVNSSIWMGSAPLHFLKEVPLDQEFVEIHLVDPTPGNISGFILDANGQPPQEADITLSSWQYEFVATGRIGGKDGYYVFNLPPGTYERSVQVEGQGLVQLGTVELQPGESIEWSPRLPPTVPLRLLPRSGPVLEGTSYRLQAVGNWRTELQKVVVIEQGKGTPKDNRQVLPGSFVYLIGRGNEVISRTRFAVEPQIGGGFDPNGDGPPLVSLRVLLEGTAAPAGTRITIKTQGETPAPDGSSFGDSERGPGDLWLVPLQPGQYRVLVELPGGRTSEHSLDLAHRGSLQVIELAID